MSEKNFIINQNTNISYKKNITETRLETYPNESYFEMVGQEVFQEHSNNFKSTLDKIKSVKEPSIDPKLDQYIRFTLKTLMIFLMKKLKNLENTTLI
jgi:hypothetical protein